MDIPRLGELLDINALKFYNKYIRGTLPSYFYSFNITTQGENHSYNTHPPERPNSDKSDKNSLRWQQVKNIPTDSY